ncbi:hypothetical protein LY474_22390 [Myxococcus stipitatus]|uniref:hypothetical protein n=1 Tax=Myxococcus stipitatus TaxID=83455 RepID=UPI001F21C02C|nr:hypothetical protein [Myxococcus stipitatus]MCE9670558.1 hypothetical protein [Myxococcus stipitatus]
MQTLSRLTASALVSLAFLSASPAFAEAPSEDPAAEFWAPERSFPRWIGLSVRGGYLMPGGRMDASEPPIYLYEVYKGLFSAILEPTLRLGSHVELGPWVQLSYVQMRLQCSANEECPGSNLRYGFQANYHWHMANRYSPWAGLSVGYEKTSFSLPDVEATYSGLDLTLQAGFDRNLIGPFWAGLFLSGTVGKYGTLKLEGPSVSGEGSIRERTVHVWIGFGFRLRVAAPLVADKR